MKHARIEVLSKEERMPSSVALLSQRRVSFSSCREVEQIEIQESDDETRGWSSVDSTAQQSQLVSGDSDSDSDEATRFTSSSDLRRSRRSVTANVGIHLVTNVPTVLRSPLWKRRNSKQLGIATEKNS